MGEAKALISIPSELDDLSIAADYLFFKGGIDSVIMGHTHVPSMKSYDFPFVGNKVYVNSGSWVDRIEKVSWVETNSKGNLVLCECTGFDHGEPVNLDLMTSSGTLPFDSYAGGINAKACDD